MTPADIALGLLVSVGFFVASAASRLFRNWKAGILLGGVIGLGFSVTILAFGLPAVVDMMPVTTE